MGKEAFNTGSELLIDTLKGENIENKMDKRIQEAKKRIINRIEDGISSAKLAKTNKNTKDNQEKEPLLTPPVNKSLNKDHAKVGKYSRLHNDTDYFQSCRSFQKNF